nr:MAG TPA: PhTx neurotoxin family [Bacteriophage sp.]
MFVIRTFNGQWCVYSDQVSKTLLLLYIQIHTI